MRQQNVERPNVRKLERPRRSLGVFGYKKLWLMVRETVPSQQQPNLTTIEWVKTTASSPLEKVTSDCLNQNGDLNRFGLSPGIGILACVHPALHARNTQHAGFHVVIN